MYFVICLNALMSQFLLSVTMNKIMSYTIANLTPVQHRVLTSFYQLMKELQNSPPAKTYGVIAINNN